MNNLKIYLLLLVSFVCTVTFGQNAKKLLDEASSKLNAMEAIETDFELGTFQGATPVSQTIIGEMIAKKNKLFMITQEMTTWYDGKTQWSWLEGSDEVNVSEPTEEEMSRINPYSFLNLYKKGFTLSASEADYHGTPAYEIRMKPEDKRDFHEIEEIRLTLSKETKMPLCIRIGTEGNRWTRIRIKNLMQTPAVNDAQFKFNAEEYPHLDLIDLR